MKKFLLLTLFSLMLAGCVAYPVYDSAYYYSDYYGPYPYTYVSPGVNVYISGSHGGHRLYGGRHIFHGGGHGFHRGGGHGFHGGRR